MKNLIPAWWTEVLRAIQTNAPSAHIAGGALRDLNLLRPVKDLDIFVPAGVDYFGPLRRLGWEILVARDSSYFEWEPRVAGSTQFTKEGNEVTINVIEVNGDLAIPEANIQSFDFGICRIAYDGNFVITTPEYDEDFVNGQFVIRRCENVTQMGNTLRRYDRLQSKYQGWPLVIPEEFQALKDRYDKSISFDELFA